MRRSKPVLGHPGRARRPSRGRQPPEDDNTRGAAVLDASLAPLDRPPSRETRGVALTWRGRVLSARPCLRFDVPRGPSQPFARTRPAPAAASGDGDSRRTAHARGFASEHAMCDGGLRDHGAPRPCARTSRPSDQVSVASLRLRLVSGGLATGAARCGRLAGKSSDAARCGRFALAKRASVGLGYKCAG